MKPRSRPDSGRLDLFQARFEQALNLDHPLCVLAGQINCARFDVAFAECYCPDTGAPATEVRLLVGLHYLRRAFSLSNEALVQRWVENPYWQYFCGHGVSPCEDHARRCSTSSAASDVADEVASAGR